MLYFIFLLLLLCLLLATVDPTALERGAKALKELDSSPNAARAFEVIKLQEMTKQKELQKEMEQVGSVQLFICYVYIYIIQAFAK